MIKILIVDDDNLVREAVAQLLQQHRDLDVAASLCSGEDALVYLKQNRVQLVLLDLHMPGMNGYETTKKIRKLYPYLKIIILTSSRSGSLPHTLMKAGANAYLTKGCHLDELFKAIKRVLANQVYIDQEMSHQLAVSMLNFDKSPFEGLAVREMEVVVHSLHGMKPNEVAEVMSISPKTVSTHRSRIFEKLGIKTDIELVKLAIHYQLIDPL